MHVISVNVGQERPILRGKPSGRTGIYKIPTAAPVRVTPLGLEGDAIVDTQNHGGLDQAVYVFTALDYAWWSAHLGRELAPGTFGDNLTVSGLESATLRVGDRLRVGQVLLEITAPRIPCVTLAARMEDPQFVKKYRHAEKPGVYCRVIEPGNVAPSDPVELIGYQGPEVTVLDMFRCFYKRELSEDELRRFLAVPIPAKVRSHYEEKLAQMQTTAVS
jgi:MOSC domain-containing protein YiiM